MITYRLDWEAEDGAMGLETYTDELDAQNDLDEMIQDGSITCASITKIESYGGMVLDMDVIREYEKQEA